MGFFRFHRSIKILPGVRWNINKGGSSFTFGGRGLKYTIGNKGSRTTVGLPGTGLSFTQVHSRAATLPSSGVKGRARGFYIAGSIILGIWILGKLGDLTSTPSQTTSAGNTPNADDSSITGTKP